MTVPPSGARAVQADRIRELDGVRAIAIWLVLATHLFFSPPTDAAGRAFLPAPVAVVFEHGWLGVDLFFVLSGFLITGILRRSKGLSRGDYFRQFYLRRALRILPLYLAVLAILLVGYGTHFAPYFVLCALLSANLASLWHLQIPDGAGPYWSLAVEEQFYLIWPWLVLWLDGKRLALAAVAVMAVEPVVRFLLPQHLELSWCRVDGLAMGAFLALWFERERDARSVRALALTLCGIAAAVTVAALPFGILHAGPASVALRITQAVLVFGALVAVAAGLPGTRGVAILRAPALVTTAALSYCLYLIHRPLVDGFTAAFGDAAWFAGLSPTTATLVRAACVVAAAYGVAALSRTYVELPFLRLGRGKKPVSP
jgi:peptidoglycan/LPS O-acetylase OafA/YrhL